MKEKLFALPVSTIAYFPSRFYIFVSYTCPPCTLLPFPYFCCGYGKGLSFDSTKMRFS